MAYQSITVEEDGPVGTIKLNRPDKMNAINDILRSEIDAALAEFSQGTRIRAVRIKGAGRGFSSGYDLNASYAASTVDSEYLDGREEYAESAVSLDSWNLRDMSDWLMRVRRFRKPLIAQVHGFALSGGIDLMGMADIVVAADGARFGHPAARGNGIPVAVGLLPQHVGPLRTKQLLFTGDLIGTSEALEWGLVNYVVSDEEIDEFTMRFCHRVALMSMEMLAVHKAVTNRWFDHLGIQSWVDTAVDLDTIAHSNPFQVEFARLAEESGVKSAISWRDAPYAANRSKG